MAVVITVTSPEATPTVLVLTAVPGGSLVAGDYYVRVCGAGVDSDNLLVLETQTTATRSAVSAEVMVTTDAVNNAISAVWVGTSAFYNVYCRKSTETAGYYQRRFIPNGVTRATCNTNAFTIASIAAGQRSYSADTFAINAVNTLPLGIDPTLGTVIVDIAATSTGTVAYSDLYTALNAVGLAGYIGRDASTFCIKGTLQALVGATGTINAYNFWTDASVGYGYRFYAIQGNFLNLASGFTWNWGSLSAGASLMIWSQKCFQSLKNMVGTGTLVLGGGWGCPTLLGLASLSSDLCLPSDAGDITKIVVKGANRVLLGKSTSFADFFGNYVCPYVNSVTLTDSLCTSIRDGDNAQTGFKAKRVTTNSSFDYWATFENNATEIDFIDCIFNSTTFVNRATPIVRYNNANCLMAFGKWGFSININVNDVAGTNIQGATCVMKDNAGTQLFSQTTDANGNITEQECLIGKIEANPPMGTYPSIANKTTLYTPFTLTVSKGGYENEVMIITPAAAKKMNVTLKKILGLNLSKQIKSNMFSRGS
jgi:hypothetical protein